MIVLDVARASRAGLDRQRAQRRIIGTGGPAVRRGGLEGDLVPADRAARTDANRVDPDGGPWKSELAGRIGRGGGHQILAIEEVDRGGGQEDTVALGGAAHRRQPAGNGRDAQVGARRDAPHVGEEKWCDQHGPKAAPACTPHQTAPIPRTASPPHESPLALDRQSWLP